VTTYNERGEQYEVHIRADAPYRTSEEAIALLPAPSTRLGSVTLDNVATLAPNSAPTEIIQRRLVSRAFAWRHWRRAAEPIARP
jgi:multidrug efflux pump subunit AcrB